VRRLIVDASALLAGVAGRSEGTPALVLSALIESRFEAVVCPHLLNEVARGLQSRYFRERLEEGRAADVLAGISESATHFPDPEKPDAVPIKTLSIFNDDATPTNTAGASNGG
jgi:predicted nucleic acid-binding protein